MSRRFRRFLVKTSLIIDADAVGIVVTGMSAYLVLWTTRIEHAILRDVVVVADALEASCLVAGFQLLGIFSLTFFFNTY